MARPVALGLDVTERAKMTPDPLVALARRAGSRPDDSIALASGEDPMKATRSVASNPIVRFVADALRFYMEFHSRYDGFYGAFIHDPLAVAAAHAGGVDITEADILVTVGRGMGDELERLVAVVSEGAGPAATGTFCWEYGLNPGAATDSS